MRYAACSILAIGFGVSLLPYPSSAETTAKLEMCGPSVTMTGEQINLTSPTIGAEVEVEIGASVISTGQGTVAIGSINLPDGATITGRKNGADFIVAIPAGKLPSPRFGRGLFPVPDATFRYAREGGERRGLSKPDIFLYVDPADGMSLKARLVFGLFKQDVPATNAKYQLDKCLLTNASAFRREIIYSGGAKGTVTFQYREYVKQLARPAFSQELSYDLSQGNEIGFKGARIRILKVSNLGIRYVVTKSFDP